MESSMQGFSPRYDAALGLAAHAHRAQLRKGSEVPYIVHPVHVSTILLRYGFAEDLVIAGLLHDVVEDQGIPLAKIEAGFGPDVARIVAAVTEQKREEGIERDWQVRKQETLDTLVGAGDDVVAVKAADVLHNVRSIAWCLRRNGPDIWHSFKRGPEVSLWYYQGVAAIVRERLGSHPLVAELDAAIQDLKQAVAETSDR
jgi:(p)ppGpp synthase/HD superfamily hydrolase